MDDPAPSGLDDDPLHSRIAGNDRAPEGLWRETSSSPTGCSPISASLPTWKTWHWAMQLNQALAVRAALDHFRSWGSAHDGCDRVAAQRLLAGDVVGRDRRRRAPEAAPPRAARGIRTARGDDSATGRGPCRGPRQRLRRRLGRNPPHPPSRLRRHRAWRVSHCHSMSPRGAARRCPSPRTSAIPAIARPNWLSPTRRTPAASGSSPNRATERCLPRRCA